MTNDGLMLFRERIAGFLSQDGLQIAFSPHKNSGRLRRRAATG